MDKKIGIRGRKVGPVAIIDEKVCHSLISDAESATLMPPLSSWLMVGEWELERFPHENREGRQAAWTETKGAFNGAGSFRIHCWTWRGSGVTARSHWDSAPFGEHWGRSWLSTAGAGRSSEVSPPHNVTNPSGMTTLHTPAHPLPPTILDNWVKTPAWALPQARTETSTPPVAASRPITSHLGCSALSPSSLFFFSGFGVLLLILCLQDFYQGLAQTYATCHPAFHGHTAWSQTQSEAWSGETLWHITNNSPYSPALMEEALKTA